ncbi:MAG: thiamine phosphate synthase [Solirubrobacterales bacterium]|nr:thiamine phosphate synthase [Solirubrobacterales bacterium]
MASDRHVRLDAARLYLVSGARPGGRALADVLRPALRGGVDLFQLREKDARDEAVLAAAQEARALCDEAGALFILNDRPDLVEAAGADGVHVGQDDMPVARARALVGAQRIVGRSTHEPAHLAAAAGADYVAVGPVHETPTKPGRPAAGPAYVRHAAAHDPGVPWFAIGGIDEHTVGEVVAAGARRIVVVRAITEAPDPERAARTLRAALDRGELRGAA